MQIWVDADACPKPIKDILFRAAERTAITTTLVANQQLPIPPSRYIKMLRVHSGFDVADNEIVSRLSAGDLVITGDIPLASEVLAKGGHAINPRGERYSQETIKERLNMRDFMDTLRASGIDTGGPAALSARDVQAFANQLDGFLVRRQLNNGA
ncbi:YaiI/YqxD family protein [Methylovulum psychrotolerans]|uniref:YaiI/YqxD family protein n=1 Tax=Methylovulum psychrotolerans TaxID=1704499 RepID=UPI001BFF32D7|nr:YaiI/YqxD family protein [Methylovulum psychrotolerans]MBT9097888.1 YaiI/YqxD family protein [Methylovulum psychrotolerans]